MWSLLYIHLGILALISQGQACTLTLGAGTLEETQASEEGSGNCIWTINVNNPMGDEAVAVRFRDLQLTVPDTCDVSNGISVYDGDTGGDMLGIVCGSDGLNSFYSRGTMLTLSYPASLVNATETFSVAYSKEKGCSTSVTGVEGAEYTVVSPRYPSGLSGEKACRWYVFPPTDSKRVHITLESPTGTSCMDVSVKIKTNRLEEEYDWCPGQWGVFQSWETGLVIDVTLNANQALLMKYRAIKESTCKGKLNGTNEIQYITTPNYPQPFPSYTECRWQIDNTVPRNGSLRIEVEDMVVDTTEGCIRDVLIIKNDLRYQNVIAETCSGLPSYFTYDHRTLVIFKSWRASNSFKGFKIKYFHGEAENCTGLLTATNSDQIIESPGYPILYPNSANCAWSINLTDATNYIRLEILDMDTYNIFGGCSDDYLEIYDGFKVAHRLCGSNKITMVGTDETILVHFSTDGLQNARGFRLSYREVDASSQNPVQLKPTLGFKSLTTPRYPDGLVKNLEMTWTFIGQLKDLSTMLKFTDVDVGDPDDCSNNHIKVYYGNTSSSMISTVCGTDTEVFMSSIITVIMKTGAIPRKRGFIAQYEQIYSTVSAGCDGTLGVVNTYSISTDEFKTLNYPSKYPNMMNCLYVVKAVLSTYKMKFHFEDVDMDGAEDPDCQRDYIEIFDGNSTSAKLFGRFCRNTTQTFESSGDLLLLRVVSDSLGAGRGARISFNAFGVYDEGVKYLWLIILGSILGVIVIVVAAGFIYVKLRKTGSGAI